jgi:hypothetical protein
MSVNSRLGRKPPRDVTARNTFEAQGYGHLCKAHTQVPSGKTDAAKKCGFSQRD